MAGIAGNKQRYNKHTLDVQYAELMEIEWGVTNEDVPKKFSVPKSTLSTWKKNSGKIVTGGTKR